MPPTSTFLCQICRLMSSYLLNTMRCSSAWPRTYAAPDPSARNAALTTFVKLIPVEAFAIPASSLVSCQPETGKDKR